MDLELDHGCKAEDAEATWVIVVVLYLLLLFV
jgi:hypothetical protein